MVQIHPWAQQVNKARYQNWHMDSPQKRGFVGSTPTRATQQLNNLRKRGRVWLIALALKARVSVKSGTVGSNPTASAENHTPDKAKADENTHNPMPLGGVLREEFTSRTVTTSG